MSLADLSTTLAALPNNPLFQLGTGIMAASGPSPTPVGFGQALGGGMTYANQLAMKQAQMDMMRAQFQRFAWQNALLQKALGGQQGQQSFQNPNFSNALAGSATQRATDATSPQDQTQTYGSQGFTPGISATPTQIASQQFPALSQGGAQATGIAPPQEPQQGAQASAASPSVLHQILGTPAGMASFALNPEGTMNFALSRQFGAPTPAMTNMQAAMSYPAGSPQRQLMLGQVLKSGAITTRNGALLPNGKFFYTPTLPDGVVLKDPTNPAGGVILPPGMSGAAAQMSAANAAGKAGYEPVTYENPQGAKVTTTAANLAQAVNGKAASDPMNALLAQANNAIQMGANPNKVQTWLQSQAAKLGMNPQGAPAGGIAGPSIASAGEAEGWGKANAEFVQKAATAAEEVPTQMARLSEMRFDLSKFDPNAFASWSNKAASWLNAIDPTHTYAAGQLKGFQDFAKNASQIALSQAKTMGSRIAAQEVGFIAGSNPNVDMTKGALNKIIGLMEGFTQANAIQNHALVNWHASGGSTDQFRALWSQADVPGILALQRMSPQDAAAFMKAQTPMMRKQIAQGIQIAQSHGWVQ